MKTKICTKCGTPKELSEFSKDKQKRDKLSSYCKECAIIRVHSYNKNHKNEKAVYDKTRRKLLKHELSAIKHDYYLKNKDKINKKEKERHEKYPWKRIFYGIKDRCENKNSQRYKDYGGRGIKNKLTLLKIKYMWIRDGAYKLINASIDRKK